MTNPMTRAQYEAEAAKRDCAVTDASATLEEALRAIPVDADEAKVVKAAQAEAREAVEAARQARAKLEDAWRAHERRRTLDQNGLTEQKRSDAADKAIAACERQASALRSIVKAISSITPHVSDYLAARDEIAAAVREHWQVLHHDEKIAKEQVGVLLSALNDTRQESDFLQANLFEALGEFGIGRKDTWLRKRDARLHVDGLNDRRAKEVASFIRLLMAIIEEAE